jgi:predicted ABC-type ATPase
VYPSPRSLRLQCNEPYLQSTLAPRSWSLSLHVSASPGAGDVSPVQSPDKKKLYPKAGDIVRYFDIDGGKEDGQAMVGKVSFIQKNIGGQGSGWTLDVTEMEDLGDGYYGDFSAIKRKRRTTRDLLAVSPLPASFVRTENAWKIPRDPKTGRPRPRVEQYDVEGYEGPFSGANAVDQTVVEADAEVYAALKNRLLRDAAIAGLAGTLIANLSQGLELATIYAAGALASLIYLFLLSVNTDTVATDKARLGKSIASVRFVLPLFVIMGVAWYDNNLGNASPAKGIGSFELIAPTQFAAATLGFLTYRLPLFFTQIQDTLKGENGDAILPGSLGLAMQLAKDKSEDGAAKGSFTTEALTTVLLVSGPQAAGRSELVKRLIAEGEGRYISPERVDRISDPINFERLDQRGDFLVVDASGRYGTTKKGVIDAAKAAGTNSVVVIDASVDLAKVLTRQSGLRIVGVWVGLSSVNAFEERIAAEMDSDGFKMPDDETRERFMRTRVRQIVKEVEYGISSGIFEFTILNEDEDDSMKQLRDAASYCFK